MAENLNYYTASGSSYYLDDSLNYSSNGRMYRQEIALEVCPSGWHLSSDEDWKKMEVFLGIPSQYLNNYERGTNEGDKLKEQKDCTSNSDCGITNFNATITGFYIGNIGGFYNIGYYGFGDKVVFITSTIDINTYIVNRLIFKNSAKIYRNYLESTESTGGNNRYYVRCVKN